MTIGERTFLLKPGFAELALATGASVIPYFSSWQEDGHMHTVFLPSMAEPHLEQEAEANHSQVVQRMVDRYARFVDDGLRTMPEAWTWAVTSHYLQQPQQR